MLLTAICILALAAAAVRAESEIDVDDIDRRVMCGDTVTFTYTIDKDEVDKVPAGTVLSASFWQDPTFGSAKVAVENVAETTHGAAMSFTYTFPNPLPSAWTSSGKDYEVRFVPIVNRILCICIASCIVFGLDLDLFVCFGFMRLFFKFLF